MGADSAETAHRMTGYYRQLDQAALAPLWESLAGLAPREPAPKAQPHLWRYDQARGHLLEARLPLEQVERGVGGGAG